MPWNDNSKPGPWGARPGGQGPDDKGEKGDGPRPDGDGGRGQDRGDGGGRGPWGSGPQGSGGGNGGSGPRRPQGPRRPSSSPQGPDLDELIRQLRDRLSRIFGGRGGGDGIPKGAIVAAVGIVFLIWGVTGVYQVQPDEEGVVTRFGKYVRSESPGLRYHLPGPIEKVEKVSVTSLKRLDVGGAEAPEESLMLTGDENIVDLSFSVQWRVQDAARFLFRMSDPDTVVKMVAESAVREVVGKSQLQAILTTGRGQVQAQAAELMQRILDQYGAGVSVVEVQIRIANPPPEVIAAFREVANAGQDAEAAVNEANAYRNRVINEAKGDAARITQSAEAYKEQAIREAEGEASRFAQVVKEYRAAPAVTRQRLYLETMERVLRNSNKVIVDGKGGTAPIVLPPDLIRPQRSATAPPVVVQAQPQAQGQAAQQGAAQ